MSDILNISPKNSYLTTKQWEEVVEYVKNRKNVVEEVITEETNDRANDIIKEVHSEAYEQLIQTSSIEEMYIVLLAIMNEEPDKLFEMTSDEIQTLYNIAAQMNEENPSEDYADLVDTLQYLAGDYELNGAEVLATETWSGEIGAKTYTGTDNIIKITGDCTLTGKITISNNTTVTITGSGTISRGASYLNEMFNIYGSATLTIKGDSINSPIKIYGGKTTASNVRTMFRCDHNLHLENVELYGNNCTVTRDYSVTTLDDTNDNFAGGAITLCDNENNVTIKNCKIYDNTSAYGAGIYLCRTGSGVLTIENTVFDNCNATTSGGAIFFDGKPSTNETIPVNGYLNYTVNLNNITIQNCDSGGCGSAIYLHNKGKANVVMTNCTVENCVSSSLSCGTIRCDGNSRYKLTVDNCLIQNNEAKAGHGAGIYWNALGEGASLVVKNSRILNNMASGQGGGMFVEGSSITVTNTLISGNKADMGGGIGIKTFADSGLTTEDGVTGTSFNLELGDGVVIENNIAISNGGGIAYNIVSGVPTSGFEFNYINDGAIIRNNVVSSTGELTGIPDGVGGGIAIIDAINPSDKNFPNRTYSANTFMKSGKINGNKASEGGAVHITMGDFEMTGGTIEGHKASGNGGSIYIAGGNFTMSDGVFNDNTAEKSGGAIYITDGDIHIQSGEITNNIALEKGGAIAVTSGDVIIGIRECHDAGEFSTHSHPIIEGNIASDGGGIYVDGGITTMWCGDIKQNLTYDKTVNVLVVSGGNFVYNGGTIGIPYDTGVFVNGGIFEDKSDESENVLKHELHYHSVVGEVIHNGRIPESKWIASPRGDVLFEDEYNSFSPTWGDLFPNYEFVGWENKTENDTDKIVNLYAIWEEK